MNYPLLVLKFFIGGGTVVAATLLAKYVSPKWAGLVAAAPIISAVSYIFIVLESNTQVTQEYLLSSVWFMIPAAIFLISIYLLMFKYSPTISFGISLLIFGMVTLGVQRFV